MIEICLMIYFSGVMTSGDSTVFQFPLLEVQEIVPQLRKLGNIPNVLYMKIFIAQTVV
jgi:hypothetical protein